MEEVYAVVSREVSTKGRIFPNQQTFLAWINTMAGYKRHGLTVEQFYMHWTALVKAGRLQVDTRKGNVHVKRVDSE